MWIHPATVPPLKPSFCAGVVVDAAADVDREVPRATIWSDERAVSFRDLCVAVSGSHRCTSVWGNDRSSRAVGQSVSWSVERVAHTATGAMIFVAGGGSCEESND